MAFASVGRRTIKIRSKLEAVGEIRLDARFERPCPGRTTSSRRPYADHLSQSGSIPMSEAGSIPMSVNEYRHRPIQYGADRALTFRKRR
jgi:hypothetical protein